MDLFLVSRADIFAIYPQILKKILQDEDAKRLKEGALTKDFVNLPSDADFQERVYYRLLEVQKAINALVDSGMPLEEIAAKKDRHCWDAETLNFTISPLATPSPGSLIKRRKCVADDPIGFLNLDFLNMWSLEDLAKAGKLLRKPPLPCQFADEHEMRRVYSMIYDVFRFKHVLSQAIHDVSFFTHYPDLFIEKNRIWLILYDLHLRHFLKRDPEERIKQKYLYKDADLEVIQKSIWKHRIHLAASISRLRIKNSALNLSQLLPTHLQNEKVAIAAANPIVTGWINPFKVRTKTVAIQLMLDYGFFESKETEDGECPLEYNYFKWDKVCPLFLSCIPMDRGQFAQSDLIKENKFIMQDRAFSLGPAIFSRLLDFFEIEGDVVQTHVSSPRATAYLAALFQSNSRVNSFMAYGAGSRCAEYRDFMKLLGCDNIKILSSNFCDVAIESATLEKVVGIFVTPPNSYSGVTDPIDLICSRGGDLTMLEVLTESEMSDDGKQRVAQLLEQQRESLRLSMSRPQVQFCLYETHSVVESENQAMVKLTIDDINRCAHTKHIKIYKEKKRLEALAEAEGITVEQLEKLQGGSSSAKKKVKQADDGAKKFMYESESSSSSSSESENETLETSRSRLSKRSNATSSDDYSHIKIPKTDIFESIDLPDFCLYQDRCLNIKEQGCFLSLIKRRHVTHLDEKYLILMAERRGLFGDSSPKRGRSRPPTKTAKKEEKLKTPKKAKPKKSEDISILVERISAPTHCSIKRSHSMRISSAEKRMLKYDPNECGSCLKHENRSFELQVQQEPRAKHWWVETTKYVKTIKEHLEIKSEKLFEVIKSKKIAPLILPREIYYHSQMPLKPWNNERRSPYPLSTSSLEFQEYRHPEFNYANFPPIIIDIQKENLSKSIQRPIATKVKPLGYANYYLAFSNLSTSYKDS